MSDNRTDCQPGECTHLTEVLVKLDFLASELKQVKNKVEELNDWMHTAKGGMIVITTLILASIGAVLTWIFKRW